MSYMGANVLHDDAVFPVRQKNIPINIRTINQACDEQSIVIGVNNQDLVLAIKAIYQQFISEERVER